MELAYAPAPVSCKAFRAVSCAPTRRQLELRTCYANRQQQHGCRPVAAASAADLALTLADAALAVSDAAASAVANAAATAVAEGATVTITPVSANAAGVTSRMDCLGLPTASLPHLPASCQVSSSFAEDDMRFLHTGRGIGCSGTGNGTSATSVADGSLRTGKGRRRSCSSGNGAAAAGERRRASDPRGEQPRCILHVYMTTVVLVTECILRSSEPRHDLYTSS